MRYPHVWSRICKIMPIGQPSTPVHLTKSPTFTDNLYLCIVFVDVLYSTMTPQYCAAAPQMLPNYKTYIVKVFYQITDFHLLAHFFLILEACASAIYQ